MRRLRATVSPASLEIRLVPRAATEGFLDGLVWAIPLTDAEARELLRLSGGSGAQRRARHRLLQAFVRRHVRQHGLPVHGTLADYAIDFGHVFLRFQLEA